MLDKDILQELNNNLAEDINFETIHKELDSLSMQETEEKNISPLIVPEEDNKKRVKKNITILGSIAFVCKYIVTCGLIFAILLVGTNYSAYYTVAKSYLMKEEVKQQQQSILNSVEAANIQKVIKKEKEEEIHEETKKSTSSIKKYKKELDAAELNMDIEITPYENRVVIPKIGKNIPLIDIKNRTLKEEKELDNIFMKELENGVVRYPGSAIPGEVGNTFIFGHSSNFPWMNGDYNDVFAALGNVVYDDEIIIYYNQKKYVYKITEKRVITPGDVSVLQRNHNKKEVSIMTCWPIGTTYNRLIITGELVETK